jgi:hypothetical protein
MITAGTAENPVLYVSSSDPRIDSHQRRHQLGCGLASDLERFRVGEARPGPWAAAFRPRPPARTGSRSTPTAASLYLAQGGHTNMGAPSNNFKNLPEYALSAAILSIDLDAIGESDLRPADAEGHERHRSVARRATTRRRSSRADRSRSTRPGSATPTTCC